MAVKNSNNKKQPKTQNRSAQILFAVFAVILILSMVLSAVSTY